MMKKIFTLFAMLGMAVAAQAQVVFVSPDGKEYANGETMVIKVTEEVYDGITERWFESPSLKNKGTSATTAYINYSITSLPTGGKISDCSNSGCTFYESGQHTTGTYTLKAGEQVSCFLEATSMVFGVSVIDCQLYVGGQPDAAITIRYENPDPQHLDAHLADDATIVETYNMLGQRVATATPGIVIERMSDGRIRKTLKR